METGRRGPETRGNGSFSPNGADVRPDNAAVPRSIHTTPAPEGYTATAFIDRKGNPVLVRRHDAPPGTPGQPRERTDKGPSKKVKEVVSDVAKTVWDRIRGEGVPGSDAGAHTDTRPPRTRPADGQPTGGADTRPPRTSPSEGQPAAGTAGNGRPGGEAGQPGGTPGGEQNGEGESFRDFARRWWREHNDGGKAKQEREDQKYREEYRRRQEAGGQRGSGSEGQGGQGDGRRDNQGNGQGGGQGEKWGDPQANAKARANGQGGGQGDHRGDNRGDGQGGDRRGDGRGDNRGDNRGDGQGGDQRGDGRGDVKPSDPQTALLKTIDHLLIKASHGDDAALDTAGHLISLGEVMFGASLKDKLGKLSKSKVGDDQIPELRDEDLLGVDAALLEYEQMDGKIRDKEIRRRDSDFDARQYWSIDRWLVKTLTDRGWKPETSEDGKK